MCIVVRQAPIHALPGVTLAGQRFVESGSPAKSNVDGHIKADGSRDVCIRLASERLIVRR